MKNEILPYASSNQPFSFGGNMEESISELVPAHKDSTVINLYGNMSFSCINDHSSFQHNNQYYNFAIPPHHDDQFPILDYHHHHHHQSGLSSIMTAKRLDYHCDAAAAAAGSYRPVPKYCNYDDDHHHHHDSVLMQSVLPFPKKLSVLHFNGINKAIRNPRKRPLHEVTDHDKQGSMRMITGSNKVVNASQWKTKKKMANPEQKKPNQDKIQQTLETPRQKLQPAVRRSQKLSDKITALQKLVSPYGKTDTASVLEEAYISIKLLEDQIQNLVNKLSSSSTDVLDTGPHQHQKTEERQSALRSRGMCLVPVSFYTKDSRTLQEQPNQRLMSEELCREPGNS